MLRPKDKLEPGMVSCNASIGVAQSKENRLFFKDFDEFKRFEATAAAETELCNARNENYNFNQ